MGVFYLFTLVRGAARLGDTHINWVNLLLQSEVTRTGLTILLPTCDPDDLDPNFFNGWLTVIQGPIVTAAADDNDNQRAFLLRVVLTYRAFAMHHPDLNISKYMVFTTMFVIGALALNVDEDAAMTIAEIDQWMADNIPLISTQSRLHADA
ncbi:hypothetical protein TRAPUB_5373 [Trametes pubescens]|uniref:Uncharacterized protein n=1 Tax=Trametes pubescens TaxID=154538 RepID=A0A1M2V8P2_TRAPU|nr:hypothetical protein TRAPUB_5373 [Trametes pubescens]